MTANRNVLAAIRDGQEEVIEQIYREHRPAFLTWAGRHYALPREHLLDIYQDAVIIFYQNTVEEKITDLVSSIRTYLFGIAKNLILKHFRQQKSLPKTTDDMVEISVAPRFFQQMEQDDQRHQVKQALNALGHNCRQLLEYFYYYDFSLEAIAERMRYKNANTVKAQKHRCMKTLEEQLRPKQ